MGEGTAQTYTPEYRGHAVRLVVDTGRPIAHVAAEIGVGEHLLDRWVAAADDPAVFGDDERAELIRLHEENESYVSAERFLKQLQPSYSPKNRWPCTG